MTVTVIDDIRNLAIRPVWEAQKNYSVASVHPASGPFAEWSLESEVGSWEGSDEWWAVIFFTPPACDPHAPGKRVDIQFTLPGGAFPAEAAARRVLWIAATGYDRGMPGLRCRLFGRGETNTGFAGLRELVEQGLRQAAGRR